MKRFTGTYYGRPAEGCWFDSDIGEEYAIVRTGDEIYTHPDLSEAVAMLDEEMTTWIDDVPDVAWKMDHIESRIIYPRLPHDDPAALLKAMQDFIVAHGATAAFVRFIKQHYGEME